MIVDKSLQQNPKETLNQMKDVISKQLIWLKSESENFMAGTKQPWKHVKGIHSDLQDTSNKAEKGINDLKEREITTNKAVKHLLCVEKTARDK